MLSFWYMLLIMCIRLFEGIVIRELSTAQNLRIKLQLKAQFAPLVPMPGNSL